MPEDISYSLSAYEDKVKQAEAHYMAVMRSGTTDIDQLVIAAATVDYLKVGVSNNGAGIPASTSRSAWSEISLRNSSLMSPDEWVQHVDDQIQMELFLEKQPVFKDLYKNKMTEISKLGEAVKTDPNLIPNCLKGITVQGPFNWFAQRGPRVTKLTGLFADDMQNWSYSQLVTPEFLAKPAKEHMVQYMTDRPIPATLLRITQRLPWDPPIDPVRREGGMDPEDLEAETPIEAGDRQDVDVDSPQDLTRVLRALAQDEYDWTLSERLKAETEKVIADMDDKVETAETVITVLEMVVEICVGLVPVLGQLEDIREFWKKEDLWGRPISDFQRVLIAVFFLLQFNRVRSVLLKGLKVIKPQFVIGAGAALATLFWQSEAEGADFVTKALSKLDSQLAKDLERAAAKLGSKLSSEAKAVAKAAAKKSMSAGLKLKPDARRRVANIVTHIATCPPVAVKGVPKLLIVEFERLIAKEEYKIFKFIDAAGFERAIYRWYPNHIKGQLLEEFGYGFINAIIRNRRGKFLFSVNKLIKEGWKLTFYPGHLIAAADNRLLTDGMLVLRHPDKFVTKIIDGKKVSVPVVKIIAIFEFKAGIDGLRELLHGATSIAKLTKEYQKALTVMATTRRMEERLAAKAEGKAYRKSQAKVEQEIFEENKGFGQIVRDDMRINQDGVFKIEGELVSGEVSKEVTQFWGFVPQGFPQTYLEKMQNELRSLGYKYAEVHPLPVSYDVLNKAVEEMSELANLVWASIKK